MADEWVADGSEVEEYWEVESVEVDGRGRGVYVKIADAGWWGEFIPLNLVSVHANVLQWSVARAQVHLAQMRRELRSVKTHAYLPGTVVYGRKPL